MYKIPENGSIPLSEPRIGGNEWKYVKDCLDTGWVSYLGSYVKRFEEAVAGYVGSGHGIAVVNGTAALHISMVASPVLPDDEVIVPALTFVAPVNAVSYCRARPVFMDADPGNLCLDWEKTEDFLKKECEQRKDGRTYNRATGRRVKAILPVHVFGHPADMDRIVEISTRYNIEIIEDATESLGSDYRGKKTGSFGRTGCFSFNGNKLITTGGGGLVVTDDGDLAARIKHLTTQAKTDPFEYDHDEIGYNYRLTNVQAAIGLAQMEGIDDMIRAKRENLRYYMDLLLPNENLAFLAEEEWARSNCWFYTIKVAEDDKSPLMGYLLSKKIQVRPIWKLIHTLPMYTRSQAYRIENAAKAYSTCINLPCSAGIKKEEIEYVAETIREYFRQVR
jgi:perosamine synthetase